MIVILRQPARVSTARAEPCGRLLTPTFPAATAYTRGVTYNLGQVEGVISNGVENKILQPVDNVEELLSQRSHGVGGGVVALRSTAIACDSNGRSTSFKKFPESPVACDEMDAAGRAGAGVGQIACLDGCTVIVRLVMGCSPPSWRIFQGTLKRGSRNSSAVTCQHRGPPLTTHHSP